MKNRVFECIKELHLQKWDSDNDEFSDEYMTVEKGSVWEEKEESIIGGEIHLENDDTMDWIEISNSHLLECFKDITNDNNEMAMNEYLRNGY